MNVYDRLIQDHREVEQLFAKIVGTRDPQGRRSLCAELTDRIVAHDKAEESVYYDSIADRATVHHLVVDGREDHDALESMLNEVTSIPADQDSWLDRILEIQNKFLSHVREEEQKMFPRSREFLPPGQTEDMAAEFEREERELLSQRGGIQ